MTAGTDQSRVSASERPPAAGDVTAPLRVSTRQTDGQTDGFGTVVTERNPGVPMVAGSGWPRRSGKTGARQAIRASSSGGTPRPARTTDRAAADPATGYSCPPDAAPGHPQGVSRSGSFEEGRRRMEVGPETRTLGAAHGTSAPVTPVAGNRLGNGRLARSGPLSRNDLAGEPAWKPSFAPTVCR